MRFYKEVWGINESGGSHNIFSPQFLGILIIKLYLCKRNY